MTAEDMAALLQQHVIIMSEIQNIYAALAVVAFAFLVLMACMFFAAAWSVRKVNARQRDLEAKFTLLIDVLLQRTHDEIAAGKHSGSA